MTTLDTDQKALCAQLGHLFFAISKADGNVRPEEEVRLKMMMDKEAVGLWPDRSAEAIGEILKAFQSERHGFTSAQEAFDAVEEYMRAHQAVLTDGLKSFVLSVANAMASTVNGKNKSELIMLARLERMLNELNQ